MTKIVFIGAGSGFGPRLSRDILSCEALRDSTIALCDIHEGRLEAVTEYVEELVAVNDLPAKVESDTDRTKLLAGADFVVTSVSIGGRAYSGEPFSSEIRIPQKYGVDQSVADTVGIGGVFRFLRTAPEHVAFCRDMERLCPNAILLNYTNPMAMLTWAHAAGSSIQQVGLCHSVQGTTRNLARWLDVPYEDVDYEVAGINHQAWVLKFQRTDSGEDLYPQIRKVIDKSPVIDHEPVRCEIARQFGYFITESSGHNSEYLPYFRRNLELMGQYSLRRQHVRKDPPPVQRWLKDGAADAENSHLKLTPSHEYASGIINAVVTGEPFEINGNVMNDGLIDNLPAGCCVEVRCTIDGDGIHPHPYGALPTQCAAVNRTNINVQELAVQAFMARDKEAAFHAVALDPLTAATTSLPRMREMFEELWAAEGELLDYYK